MAVKIFEGGLELYKYDMFALSVSTGFREMIKYFVERGINLNLPLQQVATNKAYMQATYINLAI